MLFLCFRQDLRSSAIGLCRACSVDGAATCFEKRDVVDTHIDVFDGRCCLKEITEQLHSASLGYQKEYSSTWTAHANRLSDLAGSFQPQGWELKKESLFTDDDACRIMLENVNGFKKIGTVAVELQDAGKLLKQVGVSVESDMLAVCPALVDASLLKRMKAAASGGITMVCYTFAVFYIRTEMPTYGEDKIAAAVDEIKKKFSSHRVAMADQLTKILANLTETPSQAKKYQLENAPIKIDPKSKFTGALASPSPASSKHIGTPLSSSTPASSSHGTVPAATTSLQEKRSAEAQPDGTSSKRVRLADRFKKPK